MSRYATILLTIIFFASFAFAGCNPVSKQTRLTGEQARSIADIQRGENVEQAKAELLASDIPPEFLYKKLIHNRTFEPGPELVWDFDTIELESDYSLDYGFRIPFNYDPSHSYPVLVALHGAVTRPQSDTIRRLAKGFGEGYASLFEECGEEFFVLAPQGTARAPWWSEKGLRMVTEPLKRLRQKFNIDTNRVFVIGFSDGGSGCYYFSAASPTPFAAFYPLSGIPVVASMEGYDFRLHNLKNRPLYICAGEQDTLYPIAFVRTFIAKMREAGVELTFRTFEEYSHSSGYVAECKDELREWFVSKERNPWNSRIEYTASDMRFGRCDWLDILEIGRNKRPWNVPDYTIAFPLPMRLGIRLDKEYSGKGIRITEVSVDSNAFYMGMKAGDVILRYNDKTVNNPQDLVELLKGTKADSEVEIVVLRSEKELTLNGTMEPPLSIVFDYDRPFAYIKVQKTGNTFVVLANGAKRIRIALRPGFIDFTKPVSVVSNGTQVFYEKVKQTRSAVLESYIRDFDRELAATAYLEISLP